jgi:hypothetical protein
VVHARLVPVLASLQIWSTQSVLGQWQYMSVDRLGNSCPCQVSAIPASLQIWYPLVHARSVSVSVS